MSKYSGICIARQETIRYPILTRECVKELHDISTTIPMVCEKYIFDGETIVDVFVSQAGKSWISLSDEDFERQFIVIQGWQSEQT